VVKDPAMHALAVERIEAFVRQMPPTSTGLALVWQGVMESPILGGEGNREFLAYLKLRAGGL